MRRILAILLIGTALGVGLLAIETQTARAVEAGEQGRLKPSDLSIYNSVTMDCLAVKFKLGKVHQQDGLLRVTLGQSYETISTKLMARLNARVVENKLDGSTLIKTAAEFEKTLGTFRDDYRRYEVAMNNLMKMDCQSQMQAYYTALQSTRELREAVNTDVRKLSSLVSQYDREFREFREQLNAKEGDRDAATE